MSNKSNNVVVLKQSEIPRTPGVHYRLSCLTGPNKGEVYYLKGNRLVVGRSEDADIPINDVNISREHAELTKWGASYVVTDLKSQNGIIVNDLKVTQHTLKEGDKLIIGATVMKFGKIDVTDADVAVFNEKNEHENKNERKGKDGLSPGPKKKKFGIVLVAVLGVLVFFLFDSEKSQSPSKKSIIKYNDVSDELTNYLEKKKQTEDKELSSKLEEIFHRGLRELREGNYYRAIQEFNIAFILSPNNPRAQAYKDKAKQMLDEEIKSYVEAGERDIEAIRYSSAVVDFCSVIRLLQNTSEDARYKNADKRVKELEIMMGLTNGEIKCL